MKNTEALRILIESKNLFQNMFDTTRMVDPQKGILLEYQPDGALNESEIVCNSIFGIDGRCKNCTSMRTYYTNETVIKLEYSGGAVFLIFSIPLKMDGRHVVIEMIKDISTSMSTDIKDAYRVDEVVSIIDRLNKTATTDALTGLWNRRYVDEQIPTFIKSCQQLGQPFCGAIIDLDDFKKVNDTYGHHSGDRVLATVASVLATHARRCSDVISRYGGEEFFLCFPGASAEDGIQVVERIRQTVESERILLSDGQKISVTCSIGFTVLREFDDLISFAERCDRLLYRAKKSGKNRVEHD